MDFLSSLKLLGKVLRLQKHANMPSAPTAAFPVFNIEPIRPVTPIFARTPGPVTDSVAVAGSNDAAGSRLEGLAVATSGGLGFNSGEMSASGCAPGPLSRCGGRIEAAPRDAGELLDACAGPRARGQNDSPCTSCGSLR